ncbi:MAG: lysozyme inhibitor LprI family protein [Marinilabiliales bacterium]|nr:lysozyme inhibitor LprI family protein [Marinilabiliales bacterium]
MRLQGSSSRPKEAAACGTCWTSRCPGRHHGPTIGVRRGSTVTVRSQRSMNSKLPCLGALIVGAAGLPAVAWAEGPAFSCAKAQGEVETLICSDASLAALDRKLDGVYKAASAKAKGTLATRLREEQRGWIKGRNDCWKAKDAETWITATWTVRHGEGLRRCAVPAAHVGAAGGLAAAAAEDGRLRLPEQPRQRGRGELLRDRPADDPTGARRPHRDTVARRRRGCRPVRGPERQPGAARQTS